MKKFMLLLIMTLMLVCWGWQGNLDFETAPAYGQPPPPGYYCDPYYQDCTYYNYYTAPYADPLSQFFYYSIPFIGGEVGEEHREHEGGEHRGYEHGGHEHGGHEHGHH
jgi:hypothetical protein